MGGPQPAYSAIDHGSQLDPDEESGDEVDMAVAEELQTIMGDVRGIMAGRARHLQAMRQSFQRQMLASMRQVRTAVRAQLGYEEAAD